MITVFSKIKQFFIRIVGKRFFISDKSTLDLEFIKELKSNVEKSEKLILNIENCKNELNKIGFDVSVKISHKSF